MAHSVSRGLPLAAEFPEPTREQWRAQVTKVLRRSGLLREDTEPPEAVEDVLASSTYDGITVHPLYTESPQDPGVPGLAPFVRGSLPQGTSTEGWDVRQLHHDPDAALTNREVLADLENGATSVWLRLGTGGIPISDLPEALNGVHLDMVSIVLDAGADTTKATEELLALANAQGVAPRALRGSLGADPLGAQARTGETASPATAAELARKCASELPGVRAITVDGLPYHEAGGSDSQELACTLAAATTYLRWLTEAGLDVDAAARQLEFRYAATADQFLTIAKLRAARQLWERVTRACGVEESARAQQQHAVTSPAMLTRRDPWVNMLRNTIATFSAALGGAQAITTLPFDAAIGLPDSFARRIARNTQTLLLEESHLAQVIDPAGGSWYVESLTSELAQRAWQRFQEIERAGGFPTVLADGTLAEQLAETWQQRRRAIAHRTDAITGVSEFPDLFEKPLPRRPAPQQPGGGLPRHRYAEDFEQLRDAADAVTEATGSRPAVFLATLGSLAEYNARASFARNLFAAGGIDATEAGPTQSTSEVLAAAPEAAPVVCLCSTDQVYAERAAETARALKEAGAGHVLLAGKPADPPVPDVDGYIHSGCDALSVLTEVHRRLGVGQ
jgi:methylmalonyl-CoA mutase